jgi:hypothetical protein
MEQKEINDGAPLCNYWLGIVIMCGRGCLGFNGSQHDAVEEVVRHYLYLPPCPTA